MPRSMTGYGSARIAAEGVAVEVEIRSVNGRNLKVNLRLPSILAPREAEVERWVRQSVGRGNVNVTLRLERERTESGLRLRPEVVQEVARALEPLRKKGIVDGKLSADAVAHLPGALEAVGAAPLRPREWRVVKEAMAEGLGALNAMREREAAHLVRDLRKLLQSLGRALTRIERRAPAALREIQRKLEERVNALLESAATTLDEATVAREVAVLADRGDIREEVTRLRAHVDEFRSYLESGQTIGRTLEFLAQEMLREANTIGSKSADVTLAKSVIGLKSDIERLKEQLANLE